MKWYLIVLKKYVDFTGRARRKEFWMFALFTIIFTIATRVLDGVTGLSYYNERPWNGGILSTIYSLAMFLPSLAVTVRRLHDIGKTGWVYFWFFLSSVLVVGSYFIYLFVVILRNNSLDDLRAGDVDTSFLTGTFALATIGFVVITLALSIWFLVLLCKDSSYGDNKYGPNPKGMSFPTAE